MAEVIIKITDGAYSYERRVDESTLRRGLRSMAVQRARMIAEGADPGNLPAVPSLANHAKALPDFPITQIGNHADHWAWQAVDRASRDPHIPELSPAAKVTVTREEPQE